jgi:hypothetical protein
MSTLIATVVLILITVGDLGTGKITSEMKTQSTFTDWDFDTVWDVIEGTTYPYLRDNIPETLPQ